MTYAFVETESGHVYRTDNPSVFDGPFLKGKRLSKAEGARRYEAQTLESLRNILKKGDTVYSVLRSVSRSGMSRKIDFYAIGDDKRPIWLTGYMAALRGRDSGGGGLNGGMRVDGCGMDMGFHEVYSLARTLWPNGDENEKDGGRLLKHEWI